MNIVYVSALDIFRQSGASEHILGVAVGLAELGHGVHLVAASSSDTMPASVHGHFVRVDDKGGRSLYRISTTSALALDVINQIQPDIVYIRSYPLDFIFLTRHLGKHKINFVYEMNAITDHEYISKRQYMRARLYRWNDALSVTRSVGWLPATSEVAEFMSSISGVSRPFCIADNGVWPNEWYSTNSRQETRGKLQTPQDAIVYVMAGCERPWHGGDRAIRMLSSLNDSAYLWLVGVNSKSAEEVFKRLARENYVEDRVRIVEWLPKSKLADVLAAADVGLGALAVDRKGVKEIQAVKIGPYMAAGLPVLTNCYDPRLQESLPFIEVARTTDPSELALGAIRLQDRIVSRNDVREYVRQHLSWHAVAKKTADFLESVRS